MAKLHIPGLMVDPAASVDGHWFDIMDATLRKLDKPHPTHFCLRIGRIFNPKHRAKLAELREAHRATLERRDDESKRLSQRLDMEAFCECVITDWANVPVAAGEPAAGAYSVADMADTLLDPAADYVRQIAEQCSQSMAFVAAQEEASALGN